MSAAQLTPSPIIRLALPALLVLTACEAPTGTAQEARKPQRLNDDHPAAVVGHIVAADAAAIVGDRKALHQHSQAAAEAMRRSMKLPDATRRVDPELARVAAKRVPGVRSAVWLDRENLLLIVQENEHKSQDTIDRVCIELEPLGDTLGVVVNLQSGAATTGDELEILSRNCQLDPGDRALLQRNRQVDVIAPSVRAQHKANQNP
jgi:hypothetical protein